MVAENLYLLKYKMCLDKLYHIHPNVSEYCFSFVLSFIAKESYFLSHNVKKVQFAETFSSLKNFVCKQFMTCKGIKAILLALLTL